jgi:hypothetical protein
MVGGAVAGHRMFLHVWGPTAPGQNKSSPGFGRFAGQRPVRQRSISADGHFGYFWGFKSNKPPAANERADVVVSTK